jgi:putative transcriptional regulator
VRVYTVTVPEIVDVKKVRAKLKMSQDEFSRHYGFKPATVRDWEQGRRKPDRAARILLSTIDKEPDVVERVLATV